MLEIFQNTLFKWIFRQGSDANRKQIVLNSGEPGFTTDTKRLWVGDGVTNGGVLVGNLFKGSGTDVTTFAPCEIGDLAFDTDNNNLYRLKQSTGGSISDWEIVGAKYSAGDATINISSSNQISVNANALSSFTINPIYIRYDGAGSGTIKYQKNITSVTKSGTGNYIFNYGPLETANLIPNIQIFGESNLSYIPRVISLTNQSCQVKFQNLTGGFVDTEMFFTIIR
jgi:hypothetical protein